MARIIRFGGGGGIGGGGGGGADAPTLGDDGGRRGTWQATLTPVLDSRSFAVWSICAVPHPPRYTPPPILPCPAQLAPRAPPYSSLDATRRRFSDQPELFSPSNSFLASKVNTLPFPFLSSLSSSLLAYLLACHYLTSIRRINSPSPRYRAY